MLLLTTTLDIGVHNLRLNAIGGTVTRCKGLEEILHRIQVQSCMNTVVVEFVHNLGEW